MELRKEFRYPLSAAVTFLWEDEGGSQQKAEGITRDISTRGAFIYAAISPPEKAAIRIEVGLAPFHEGKEPLHIHIKGHVVRVEERMEDPAHTGFAVVSESTILSGGEASSEKRE